MLLVVWQEGHPACKKSVVGCWCGYLLGARCKLHMAELMPLPLTFSCSSKIQIGFILLVPAHSGSPGQWAIKRVLMLLWQCLQESSMMHLNLWAHWETFSGHSVIAVCMCKCASVNAGTVRVSQSCCLMHASEMQLFSRMWKVTLRRSRWTTCFQQPTKEHHSPTQNTALWITSSMLLCFIVLYH